EYYCLIWHINVWVF
nr:immunoglobulin light chain junction region [Macaca mulatta]MOX19485.1 immunoglobulin light chain junction region [Macaca mulatta]MOX19505.1 immunoglobulin light chain junction region [Macaca mulatta]MOX19667.1 immunoglobulin light chain junction region [Macaca mulatta]MOX20635.1 immunoglobulin light chain junction region [Macaca mulatta]